MREELLLEAIGLIDDDLVDAQYTHSGKTPLRLLRTGLLAAALVLLMAVSAMAFSPELRQAVLSILNISVAETPPVETGGDETSGLNEIGVNSFDGVLTVHYFSCGGFANIYDGRLYTCDDNAEHTNPQFWTVTKDGVRSMPGTQVDFPLSWGGTDFRIRFDYAVVGGELQLFIWPENLDQDPYRYGWDLQRIGNRTDAAVLLLPEYVNKSAVQPMLLDLKTLEVTPLANELPLEGYEPFVWWFSDDLRWAKLYAWRGDGVGVELLCDLEQRLVWEAEEYFGQGILEFDLLHDGSAICRGEHDFWYFDMTTGTRTLTVPNVDRQDGKTEYGYRVIGQHGMNGYHTVIRQPDGQGILADLITGESLSLGELEWEHLRIRESPDGSHILFSWGLTKIGLLDIASGVMTVLEREPTGAAREVFHGWLSETSFVIMAITEETSASGHLLYVYDFAK